MAWAVQYEADALPENSTPAWTHLAAGSGLAESFANSQFRINGTGVAAYLFHHYSGSTLNNDTGWTFEARVKVVTNANAWGCRIQSYATGAATNKGFYSLAMYTNQVEVRYNNGGADTLVASASVTLSDQFHTIRWTMLGQNFKVWVDGVKVIDCTVPNEALTGTDINWGVLVALSEAIDEYWDYLYYDISGAYEPQVPIGGWF